MTVRKIFINTSAHTIYFKLETSVLQCLYTKTVYPGITGPPGKEAMYPGSSGLAKWLETRNPNKLLDQMKGKTLTRTPEQDYKNEIRKCSRILPTLFQGAITAPSKRTIPCTVFEIIILKVYQSYTRTFFRYKTISIFHFHRDLLCRQDNDLTG